MFKKSVLAMLAILTNTSVLAALPTKTQEMQLVGSWKCTRADKTFELAYRFASDKKLQGYFDMFMTLDRDEDVQLGYRETWLGHWSLSNNQLILIIHTNKIERLHQIAQIKNANNRQVEQAQFDSMKTAIAEMADTTGAREYVIKQLDDQQMRIQEDGDDAEMMCNRTK